MPYTICKRATDGTSTWWRLGDWVIAPDAAAMFKERQKAWEMAEALREIEGEPGATLTIERTD